MVEKITQRYGDIAVWLAEIGVWPDRVLQKKTVQGEMSWCKSKGLLNREWVKQ